MKRYWYLLIERYETGSIKAAVVKTRLADQRPPEFYKQEPGREIFGEWFDSELEAQTIATELRALDASLAGRAA